MNYTQSLLLHFCIAIYCDTPICKHYWNYGGELEIICTVIHLTCVWVKANEVCAHQSRVCLCGWCSFPPSNYISRNGNDPSLYSSYPRGHTPDPAREHTPLEKQTGVFTHNLK